MSNDPKGFDGSDDRLPEGGLPETLNGLCPDCHAPFVTTSVVRGDGTVVSTTTIDHAEDCPRTTSARPRDK